jgi:hypothetical protein
VINSPHQVPPQILPQGHHQVHPQVTPQALPPPSSPTSLSISSILHHLHLLISPFLPHLQLLHHTSKYVSRLHRTLQHVSHSQIEDHKRIKGQHQQSKEMEEEEEEEVQTQLEWFSLDWADYPADWEGFPSDWEDWPCNYCTFVNKPTSELLCEMCSAMRPLASSSKCPAF